VLALRERDREWLRRSFAAKAVADPVDFVMLAAGHDVPLTSRLVGGTLAAIAAAYARQVLGFGGAPLDTGS
jgi:poly(3-hydroxyalkanoate) synthetase